MRQYVYHDFLSAKAANGIGAPFLVKDFRNIIVDLITASFEVGSAVTIKFQGSRDDAMPDFSAAASVTNPWSYIQVVDLDTGLTKDGSNGITFSGADGFGKYEMNVNGLTWACLEVTAYNAPGSITSKATGYSNE